MRDGRRKAYERFAKAHEASVGAACLYIPPVIRWPEPYRNRLISRQAASAGAAGPVCFELVADRFALRAEGCGSSGQQMVAPGRGISLTSRRAARAPGAIPSQRPETVEIPDRNESRL